MSDLLLHVALLPLAVTNLRAKPSNIVSASDASSWGEAGVVCKKLDKVKGFPDTPCESRFGLGSLDLQLPGFEVMISSQKKTSCQVRVRNFAQIHFGPYLQTGSNTKNFSQNKNREPDISMLVSCGPR